MSAHSRQPASEPAIDPAIVRQAVAWLVRLQSGQPDQRAQAGCRAWREADPQHERAWRRVQVLDGELRGDVARLPPAAKDCAVQALAADRRAERRRVLKGLAVALAVAPAAWLADELAPWPRPNADHATAVGERRAVTLADGSVLWLNTDSAIQVQFDDEQRLIVLMRGEVHVNSGADGGAARHRPLRVRSRHALFEALGTRFTVRDDPASTRLVVEAGAVAMRPDRARAEAATDLARAGEAYRVDRERVTPAAAPDHGAAWIDGLLVADDMRLGEFLAELARHRRGRLYCDEAVAALRLSGVYRLDDSDKLLALLPQVLPVRVETRFGLWTRVLPRDQK